MDTSPANELAQVGLEVLATVLALLAAIYLPRLFKALEKRIGKDIPDAIEIEAMRLADRAIDRAEEWARKPIANVSGKVPSTEKLNKAAEYFKLNARDKVIAWLNVEVTEYLEERLGARRSEGPTPDWVTDDGGDDDAGE
jgi:hypothetical protein